jgi:hypothetical protein
MKTFFAAFFAFLKSVFSENDGTGSFSRVAGGIIVCFTVGWVTHVVWRTHIVPDLTGPAAFLAAGSGSTYGINKLDGIVRAARSITNTPQQ